VRQSSDRGPHRAPAIGILGHCVDFASDDPELPLSRPASNESKVSATYLYTSPKGNLWFCGSDRSPCLRSSCSPYQSAHARDRDRRYANSPLHGWFEQLASKKGRWRSDADGRALSDVDWESRDGHYRVRIDGEWVDVPEDAVVTEPNRAGRTIVWPAWLDGPPQIQCFMAGSMT